MAQKKLTRRGFLGTAAGAGLGGLALTAVPAQASAESSSPSAYNWADYAEQWKSTSDQPPRKVIVGTVMQPFWGKYPGLDKRLQQLMEIVDRQQAQSQKQYGRGLDLAVLPEIAITGEGNSVGHVSEWSFTLEGPVQDAFSKKARELHAYVIAPLYLIEDKATKRCSNAGVLFGRQGEVVGIYKKVHLVVDDDGKTLEHGCTPGMDVPVFDCDFGRLGIQICYDMDFDGGWRELARKRADIVAWPSQSPQRARPIPRAIYGHYYIVSSTWRKDACVFEPTGKIVAEVDWKPSMGDPGDWDRAGAGNPIQDNILVHEFDLSYAILPYSRELKNGELFRKTFGDKAGFHYYDDEDRGIFWSNDPNMTVRQMVQQLNQVEEQDALQHDRGVYRRDGIPEYLV
jgi:predicted amidohydrolase